MLKIRQLKVPVNDNNVDNYIIKKLRINNTDLIDYKILKKSVDARDKQNVSFVYECALNLKNEELVLRKNHSKDIEKYENTKYVFPNPYKKTNKKIVIVGSGPAGLFCAYTLATNGYKVEVIERGEKVEDRLNTVEHFWNTGELNKNSNVQFGEGGAGTFSDGKLTTQIKDKNNRMQYVLETFVSAGSPENILYDAKPHIGTDILVQVVKNIREKIISLGGTFRYNTTLTDIEIENNKIKSITVNNNEVIDVDTLVLAIGHSARDTFEMLNKKLKLEPKSFAVGIRISHSQSMINYSQYGKYSKYLPPASYKLTYQTKSGRGVYSFCMCPGGYVVNASSEDNRLAINGMSYSKRDSENANSALIVTVTPKDFGEDPLAGLEFQRRLEEKAYLVGNKSIPVQLYIDYKNKQQSTEIGEVKPIVKGMYSLSDINKIFPDYINESLVEAIENFGTKIKGYNRDDALLMGVESRTSSPVRIPRGEDFESIITGIYPCGEGAGYAGGITSAAIDGVKIAEAIAKNI